MSRSRGRPQARLHRKLCQTLFRLAARQPWLPEREPALLSLLSLCSNRSQQQLICQLLERFTFLDSADAKPHLFRMVDQICKVWGLASENTQIVSVTFDDEGDSGQVIVQVLKPLFAERGWENVWTVNSAVRSVKHLRNYPNVVLVDEFSGTGLTVKKRIRDVTRYYQDAENRGRAPHGFSIRVCLLGSVDQAISEVRGAGIEIFAAIEIKKGISGYLTGSACEEAREQMLGLEAKLHPEFNGRELPSFGFGRAEALFSTDGNTPNSVFPVFWWPRLRNGRARRTILYRGERRFRPRSDGDSE